MTWTKVGDELPDECERVDLSDAAFRTHIEGLCWSNRLGLDGRLPAKHVRRFAFSRSASSAIEELVAVGFWARADDGFVIVHHAAEQVEARVTETRRDADANRKRRERLRKAIKSLGAELPETQDVGELKAYLESLPRRHVTDGVTNSVTVRRDPGLVGSGQDGTAATTEGELKDGVDQPISNLLGPQPSRATERTEPAWAEEQQIPGHLRTRAAS